MKEHIHNDKDKLTRWNDSQLLVLHLKIIKTTVTIFFSFNSGDFNSPLHNITSLTPVSFSWYADDSKKMSKHINKM